METNTSQQTEREINFMDPLIFLLKKKEFIIKTTLACALATLVVSLFLPNIYRAEVRILPPQQTSGGMATQLMNQFAGNLTGLGGLLSSNVPTDLYVGMLQSRTVFDVIITRFELKKRYGVDTYDEARKKLAKKITIQADPKSKIIMVGVEDKDPQKASDMANAFVDELKNLKKGIAVSEAAQRRLFFEDQLRDVKITLARVEESMKGFQEKTGALHVEEQVKAVIKNIGQLRAEIASKEVEIQVMKTYSTPNNPDLQKKQETLSGMRTQLVKLESKNGSGNDTLMPTGRMPSVGTEYMRKLRDLKFNETLYELLLKQYEAAKLDEARDATVIQVIDSAVPPEKKIAPGRATMVFLAALAGFFVSVLAAFLMEYRKKIILDPANRERIEQLKEHADVRNIQRDFVHAMQQWKGKIMTAGKKFRKASTL